MQVNENLKRKIKQWYELKYFEYFQLSLNIWHKQWLADYTFDYYIKHDYKFDIF